MKPIAISQVMGRIQTDGSDVSYRRRHRLWVFNLLVSSILAAVTGVFGLAIASASLLHLISSRSVLGITGTALLALTFPLLVFAAHCLDRIDHANREHRLASYRKKIFGDADSDGSDRS